MLVWKRAQNDDDDDKSKHESPKIRFWLRKKYVSQSCTFFY